MEAAAKPIPLWQQPLFLERTSLHPVRTVRRLSAGSAFSDPEIRPSAGGPLCLAAGARGRTFTGKMRARHGTIALAGGITSPTSRRTARAPQRIWLLQQLECIWSQTGSISHHPAHLSLLLATVKQSVLRLAARNTHGLLYPIFLDTACHEGLHAGQTAVPEASTHLLYLPVLMTTRTLRRLFRSRAASVPACHSANPDLRACWSVRSLTVRTPGR